MARARDVVRCDEGHERIMEQRMGKHAGQRPWVVPRQAGVFIAPLEPIYKASVLYGRTYAKQSSKVEILISSSVA